MPRTAPSSRRPAPPRIVLHVQSDPTSPVDSVTPAAFRVAARQAPALARRLVVSYADDPAALDERLREAEILVAGSFPAEDLARRAPRLRWIQSTSAGVETLVPHLPPVSEAIASVQICWHSESRKLSGRGTSQTFGLS